jgi:hypothetical protein
MSIYDAIVALNLAVNSSTAINSSPSINYHQVNQPDRIAQTVPLRACKETTSCFRVG